MHHYYIWNQKWDNLSLIMLHKDDKIISWKNEVILIKNYEKQKARQKEKFDEKIEKEIEMK
jgi:hypothetical protein